MQSQANFLNQGSTCSMLTLPYSPAGKGAMIRSGSKCMQHHITLSHYAHPAGNRGQRIMTDNYPHTKFHSYQFNRDLPLTYWSMEKVLRAITSHLAWRKPFSPSSDSFSAKTPTLYETQSLLYPPLTLSPTAECRKTSGRERFVPAADYACF